MTLIIVMLLIFAGFMFLYAYPPIGIFVVGAVSVLWGLKGIETRPARSGWHFTATVIGCCLLWYAGYTYAAWWGSTR